MRVRVAESAPYKLLPQIQGHNSAIPCRSRQVLKQRTLKRHGGHDRVRRISKGPIAKLGRKSGDLAKLGLLPLSRIYQIIRRRRGRGNGSRNLRGAENGRVLPSYLAEDRRLSPIRGRTIVSTAEEFAVLLLTLSRGLSPAFVESPTTGFG